MRRRMSVVPVVFVLPKELGVDEVDGILPVGGDGPATQAPARDREIAGAGFVIHFDVSPFPAWSGQMTTADEPHASLGWADLGVGVHPVNHLLRP